MLEALGDVPCQPSRRGGLEGETAPFQLHDQHFSDDDKIERLLLEPEEQARFEAQEQTPCFDKAELRAWT